MMPETLQVINLKCAGCGGALEIQRDMNQFACGYCGSEQIVERRGGTVALKLIVDAVARVQTGTDKTAAELALVRVEREIAAVHAQWHAASVDFAKQNSSNSPIAIIGIVISIFAALGGLNALLESTSQNGFGVFAAWFILLLASIAGLVVAIKTNSAASKRYTEGRSELWRSFAEQIQLLESLKKTHKQVVDK